MANKIADEKDLFEKAEEKLQQDTSNKEIYDSANEILKKVTIDLHRQTRISNDKLNKRITI